MSTNLHPHPHLLQEKLTWCLHWSTANQLSDVLALCWPWVMQEAHATQTHHQPFQPKMVHRPKFSHLEQLCELLCDIHSFEFPANLAQKEYCNYNAKFWTLKAGKQLENTLHSHTKQIITLIQCLVRKIKTYPAWEGGIKAENATISKQHFPTKQLPEPQNKCTLC